VAHDQRGAGQEHQVLDGQRRGRAPLRNKIWNATRFAQLNLEASTPIASPTASQRAGPRRVRLARALDPLARAARDRGGRQGAGGAPHLRRRAGVYHFIWDEVCDWYIELGKAALLRAEGNAEITANPEARFKIQGALVAALETAMRLLHPFMPFLTEEIWQQLPKPSGAPQSIMITLYPVRDVRFYDDASEASMALVQKVIVALRAIRADKGIPSATRVWHCWSVNDDYKKTILDGYKTIIAEQGKCREVRVRRAGSSLGGEFSIESVATALAGDVEVMVPLEGVVGAQDAAQEKAS